MTDAEYESEVSHGRMKGLIRRIRGAEDSGRDALTEEELAGVVVHLHDYAGLSFDTMACCMPRSHDELRDYYADHPMAGDIEPPGEWSL